MRKFSTVKAFQLTAIREMELFEVPDPEIRESTDVLIKMGAVGVCGSDIHYYTTGRIGSQVVEYPFTVGHECAGTVLEVGPEVDHVQVGDRVALEPAMPCGHCDQCESGRENTCRNNKFLGCPGQAEGSLSELLVMPQENCFKIKDSLGLSEATVSEPLAIAIYAIRQAALESREQVGILGMGPIGRTVQMAAIYEGCESIYCTDNIAERCVASVEAGANWAGNPTQQDVVAEVLERAPLGLDVVFECCGQQDAITQAVEMLRPGGKLVLIGIPEVDSISFRPERIRRKELTLINIRRQRECVQPALDVIYECPADVDHMITHRFTFDQTKEAFDLVADYQDGVVKAMIEF
jgi:L-iditol 2-dehydrogenase